MTHHPVPKISLDELRLEIKKEYTSVALDPNKGDHFHTGRRLANLLGYDESLYADLPESNIASFAGMGNSFAVGPVNQGETVVDVGSGAGFDSLIASRLVGPSWRVIGFDMTPEMLKKAEEGAEAIGATNVEFREGLAESLPLDAALPDAAGRLRARQPDVVLFDLASTQPEFAVRLWQNHPDLLLIGVDLATGEVLALSGLASRADVSANGLEVLQALRRQAYDVILMDVQMPEMDGYKVLEQRKDENTWRNSFGMFCT